VQQAESEVVRKDKALPVLPRFLLGGHDHVLGARGEAGERVRVEGVGQQGLPVGVGSPGHEALLRRLLGDAHGLADLGPRCARLAGLVDKVADQVVGQLTEMHGDPHGRRHLVKRRAFGALDVNDQFVESHGWLRHTSTLG
jgi:hypothetical protein